MRRKQYFFHKFDCLCELAESLLKTFFSHDYSIILFNRNTNIERPLPVFRAKKCLWNVTFAFWQLMSKSLLLFLIWMLGSLIHLLHFGWWMQGLWPLQGCLINELEILPEDAPTTSTCSEKHIPTTYKKRFFLILSFPE